jgi:hypothetical protein
MRGKKNLPAKKVASEIPPVLLDDVVEFMGSVLVRVEASGVGWYTVNGAIHCSGASLIALANRERRYRGLSVFAVTDS